MMSCLIFVPAEVRRVFHDLDIDAITKQKKKKKKTERRKVTAVNRVIDALFKHIRAVLH